MQPGTAILIVKSGISNHAASNILDDLCFSKFWTFHKVCPANPQTMSGLSGAPSGTASQTI